MCICAVEISRCGHRKTDNHLCDQATINGTVCPDATNFEYASTNVCSDCSSGELSSSQPPADAQNPSAGGPSQPHPGFVTSRDFFRGCGHCDNYEQLAMAKEPGSPEFLTIEREGKCSECLKKLATGAQKKQAPGHSVVSRPSENKVPSAVGSGIKIDRPIKQTQVQQLEAKESEGRAGEKKSEDSTSKGENEAGKTDEAIGQEGGAEEKEQEEQDPKKDDKGEQKEEDAMYAEFDAENAKPSVNGRVAAKYIQQAQQRRELSNNSLSLGNRMSALSMQNAPGDPGVGPSKRIPSRRNVYDKMDDPLAPKEENTWPTNHQPDVDESSEKNKGTSKASLP